MLFPGARQPICASPFPYLSSLEMPAPKPGEEESPPWERNQAVLDPVEGSLLFWFQVAVGPKLLKGCAGMCTVLAPSSVCVCVLSQMCGRGPHNNVRNEAESESKR